MSGKIEEAVHAVQYGYVDVLRTLIDNQDTRASWLFLSFAFLFLFLPSSLSFLACNSSQRLVVCLMTIATTDKDGCSLLHWAAINGRGDICQLLLEKGADVLFLLFFCACVHFFLSPLCVTLGEV